MYKINVSIALMAIAMACFNPISTPLFGADIPVGISQPIQFPPRPPMTLVAPPVPKEVSLPPYSPPVVPPYPSHWYSEYNKLTYEYGTALFMPIPDVVWTGYSWELATGSIEVNNLFLAAKADFIAYQTATRERLEKEYNDKLFAYNQAVEAYSKYEQDYQESLGKIDGAREWHCYKSSGYAGYLQQFCTEFCSSVGSYLYSALDYVALAELAVVNGDAPAGTSEKIANARTVLEQLGGGCGVLMISSQSPAELQATLNSADAALRALEGMFNTGLVVPNGENPSKSKDGKTNDTLPKNCYKRTCDNENVCLASESSGSVISNLTYNHRHFGRDYTKFTQGACVTCGGVSQLSGDGLTLYRIHSLRNITWPSSFGAGVFLNHDISLNFSPDNGPDEPAFVECFNPNWDTPVRYDLQGAVFVDADRNHTRDIALFDSAGRRVSDMTAVRGVLSYKDGTLYEFDMFPAEGSRLTGRLRVIRDANGVVKTAVSYVYTPNASVAEELKWKVSTIADEYGATASFTYGTLATGSQAVTRITIAGGRNIDYGYDDFGRLTTVTGLTGDVSRFSYTEQTDGSLLIGFNEAAENGTHRNKTAQYTGAYLVSPSGIRNKDPKMFGYASNLLTRVTDGEGSETYFAARDGDDTKGGLIHEGGGRYRRIASNKFDFSSVRLGKNGDEELAPDNALSTNRSSKDKLVQVRPNGRIETRSYYENGSLASYYERENANAPLSGSSYTYDSSTGKVATEAHTDGITLKNSYDASGNLISRRRTRAGAATVQAAGVTVPGFGLAYYPAFAMGDLPGPSDEKGLPIAAQGLTTGTQPGVAPDAAIVTLTGRLTVETTGTRAFHLTPAATGATARLYVDGLQAGETVGTTGIFPVTLSAGAHDVYVVAESSAGTEPGAAVSLTWVGPESAAAADPAAPIAINPEFVTHLAVSGETAITSAGTTLDEETWTYNSSGSALAGLIASHTDLAGKRTEYSYDGNRRLTTVSETGDDGDLVVTLRQTYDTVGRLATSSDALGRTATYMYDAKDRVIKVTYGDGTTETTTYGTGSDANLVVARKNRAGYLTKFEYDRAGREIRRSEGYAKADLDGNLTQVLPAGAASITETTYVAGTEQVASRRLNGDLTEYDYDYKGDLIASRTYTGTAKVLASTATYDSLTSEKLVQTDAYGRRTYGYHRGDLVVRTVTELIAGAVPNYQAGALAKRPTGENPGYTVTDYEYDSEGRLIRTIDAAGVKHRTDYDELGRAYRQVDAEGLPEEVSVTTTFDAAGRPVAVTDALGRVTRREYTPAGRLAAVVYPNNDRETYTYYADGRIRTHTTPEGRVTKHYWAPCCGREIAVADAQDNGVITLHDGDGRLTCTMTAKGISALIDSGVWRKPPAEALLSLTTTRYDSRGRVSATTAWIKPSSDIDGHNPPIATDSSQGLTTTYAYYDDLSDTKFAPVLAKLAAQGVTLTAGKAVIVTGPDGVSTFSVQDGAGRSVASGTFNK